MFKTKKATGKNSQAPDDNQHSYIAMLSRLIAAEIERQSESKMRKREKIKIHEGITRGLFEGNIKRKPMN